MQSWHDFYGTAGTASAALIGLLFVGVSLHLDTVVSRRDVRSTARGAFQSLLAILFVSLVTLIPQISPRDLGWTPLGLGAGGLLLGAVEARGLVGADLLLGFRHIVRRIGSRAVGFGLMLYVGIALVTGPASAQSGTLPWLMAAIFVLLASSAHAAWSLLIEVAEAQKTAGARRATSDEPAHAIGGRRAGSEAAARAIDGRHAADQASDGGHAASEAASQPTRRG